MHGSPSQQLPDSAWSGQVFRTSAPPRFPLSRQEVDRDYLSRGRQNLFDELWADAGTRVLPLWSGKALMAPGEPARLALRSTTSMAFPGPDRLLYLGRSLSETSAEPIGTPLIAMMATDDEAAALGGPESWAELRVVAAQLSDRDCGLLAEALALANWHGSHVFSPRTGAPLRSEQAGWVRRAENDQMEIFPRTDPAIIVAVVDEEDRLLLGSNAMWEHNRFSLLAGFVEPGESLEAAVVREVFEESGIRVTDPVYLGSQPWPFPASLMIGFRASVDGTQPKELVPDGVEILDLRWFSRDELRDTDLILPGKASIARAIIEDWLGGPIGRDSW